MKQQAEEQTVIGQRLKQPGQEPEPAQRRKMLQQSRPSFKTQGLPAETRQWAKLNLMVDKMFDKIDTDGSGDISIDELREDMRRRFPNISEEQIQQFFDDMDVNHDGKVSRAEFAFASLDADGSGDISFDEFTKAMRRANKTVSDEEVIELFKEMDVNRDGKISRAEFVEAQAAMAGSNSETALAAQPASAPNPPPAPASAPVLDLMDRERQARSNPVMWSPQASMRVHKGHNNNLMYNPGTAKTTAHAGVDITNVLLKPGKGTRHHTEADRYYSNLLRMSPAAAKAPDSLPFASLVSQRQPMPVTMSAGNVCACASLALVR